MPIKYFVVLLALLAFAPCGSHAANHPATAHDTTGCGDSLHRDSVFIPAPGTTKANPKETFQRKKLITCILAFPVPFGFTGLHRIYLGTEPWVPIVYLCTGGGGVGLLPFIDFLFLVTADEEEFKKYENNPNVFMFVDQ